MQPPNAEAATQPRFVLTLAAASKRGQVAAVTTMLERRGAYIEEFAAFDDVLSSRFYVRVVFRTHSGDAKALQTLRAHYAGLVKTASRMPKASFTTPGFRRGC